jgi:PASTA domain
MPKLLGHEFSQGQTIAGVGALVFVGGYSLWKYEKDKKASAAAAASATTSSNTSSQYGYGYGYGSPSQYYGYGFGYGSAVNEAGEPNEWEYGYGEYGYGYYDPATGQYEGAASGTSNLTPTGAAPTTNPEWATVATNDLVEQGYSAQTVSGALGPYLQGQAISASQVAIVQAALAYAGNPPVPGANGYPPAYNTQGTTGGGTGGGQTTSQVTVPTIIGERGEDARKTVESLGLKWSQTPSSTPKGKTTTVKTQSPTGGSKVASGSTVKATLTVS